MNKQNRQLIREMREKNRLTNPAVLKAFSKTDRIDFVPQELQNRAYEDIPLSIGYEATTSQPSTIAFMLEQLRVQTGQKILEIGTGSGYLTALLACLVGPSGRVFSIEYVNELKEFARRNLEKYNFRNIELKTGDGKAGWPKQAPFDRIIASAEADQIPSAWKEQLAASGILLTPFGYHLLKIIKKSPECFEEEKFPFFSFVKLK